jgi:hypothetical protein
MVLGTRAPQANLRERSMAGWGRPADDRERAVVRMRLVGARAPNRWEELERQPGVSNYFIGNEPKNWRTNVPNFGRVAARGVYPGVELICYGNHRQLEYDLAVAPGADPGQIQFAWSGAESLRLNETGDLVLATKVGNVVQRQPLVYQEIDGRRVEVASKYVLGESNQVRFEIAHYDRRRTLLIDPLVLVYATYLGGSGEDYAGGIALDASGSIYLAGTTSSANFPTDSSVESTLPGPTDEFVTKLSSDGIQLIYSTYLGGKGDTYGSDSNNLSGGVVVDSTGAAYVVGVTYSTDFPVKSAFQSTLRGNPNTFVTKLAPAGNALIYSTYLGGSTSYINDVGGDWGEGIAIDSTGAAYVVGESFSPDFPTKMAYQNTLKGLMNAFLTKFSPAGNTLEYSTFLGGTGGDRANSVAVDSQGAAYLAGYTSSTDFPTVSPIQSQLKSASNSNAFVTKFSPAGDSLVYSTYLGGSARDRAGAIAVDATGAAYVGGTTRSADFPTEAPLQGQLKGDQNLFLAKLNPSGSGLAYSTYLGGSGSDSGGGMAIDSSGAVYAAGGTTSPDFPMLSAYQSTFQQATQSSPLFGANNGFVLKLAPAGDALVYATYFGGAGAYGIGIAPDGSGGAWLTGATSSTGIATPSAYQTSLKGAANAMLARLGWSAATLSAQGASLTSDSGGGTAQVTVPEGSPWTATTTASWINITSGASGTGPGTVSFSVSADNGSARSGTILVGGQTFTVTQQGTASAKLPLAGSMAQIASAGGWDTTFTLVNLASSIGTAQLNFYSNDGSVPLLPFTMPQESSAGATLAQTFNESLAPNASLLLDTTGSVTNASTVGSAQLLTSGGIDGFAVFKYTPTNQQAVVPLEVRNAPSYLLPFDNTGALATGLAIASVGSAAGSVNVVVRDDTGATIPTAVKSIPLAADGHNSFMLTDSTQGFPEVVGKRGTVEFDSPTNGQISVLGLRVNSGALTTVPVLANVAAGGGTFAHIASGGGWQTTLTLVNAGTSPANVTLDFFDGNGKALALPLTFPQTAATSTASTLTQTMAAGATLIINTEGPATGSALTGSAQLATSGQVSGSAVFRYNPSGQEAIVPLESRAPSAFILAYDNTGGLATGLAISNATAAAENIPVVVRDDSGNELTSATISLLANGHSSFMLTDATQGYPQTAGKRGTVEFDVPSGAALATLGIRAQGQVITTIPVMAR